jgi:hypothetical protein
MENQIIQQNSDSESWALKVFKETCCESCLCSSEKDHTQD